MSTTSTKPNIYYAQPITHFLDLKNGLKNPLAANYKAAYLHAMEAWKVHYDLGYLIFSPAIYSIPIAKKFNIHSPDEWIKFDLRLFEKGNWVVVFDPLCFEMGEGPRTVIKTLLPPQNNLAHFVSTGAAKEFTAAKLSGVKCVYQPELLITKDIELCHCLKMM